MPNEINNEIIDFFFGPEKENGMKKLRQLKKRYDDNRMSPKARYELKKHMDRMDYGSLSKKEQDEFERYECSL